MGSVGDVYQLVDEQVCQEQRILNVYFYRLDTPVVGNAAQMLTASFIDEVLPDICAVQVSGLVHNSVKAVNLFDESEAHEEIISEAGTYTSADTMPNFNAIGIRLVGDNAAVRSGAKRYGGVSEDAATNGVLDQTAMLTALAALAVQLAAGLPIGLDVDALIPVIVQRILVGTEYTLPTTQAAAVLSEITDALFNVDVTSQTSRKKGRGE